MLEKRIIPVLLLHKKSLYKTNGFSKPKYIGDPINAIKIFNEKEVDELIFLDIDASKEGREPDYEMLNSIASECFMPLCYGGGIKNLEQAEKIFKLGVEKLALNTVLFSNEKIVSEIIDIYGSQSVIGVIDVKKDFWGKYLVYDHKRKRTTKFTPVEYALKLESIGVGEIFLNDVNNDGKKTGYNLELIDKVSSAIRIPLIACGGAGSINDCFEVVNTTQASGVAAGSVFVFHGKHDAVLITYPDRKLIDDSLNENK